MLAACKPKRVQPSRFWFVSTLRISRHLLLSITTRCQNHQSRMMPVSPVTEESSCMLLHLPCAKRSPRRDLWFCSRGCYRNRLWTRSKTSDSCWDRGLTNKFDTIYKPANPLYEYLRLTSAAKTQEMGGQFNWRPSKGEMTVCADSSGGHFFAVIDWWLAAGCLRDEPLHRNACLRRRLSTVSLKRNPCWFNRHQSKALADAYMCRLSYLEVYL
jgi:hypothetical protein